MKKFILLLAVGLLSVAAFGSVALAGGHEWHEEPHGHVLLNGVEFSEAPGGPTGTLWVLEYAKCVELANGNALRVPAHHHSVHTGNAGGSPFVMGPLWDAGHAVIPLAPFEGLPWTGCDDLPNPLVAPAPPSAG